MALTFVVLLPSLCDPTNCSTPGFPVRHHLLEFAQVHVHCIREAIQPSHPLLSPSPPAFKLSQNQGLFQWVSCSHHVDKLLELQLQHQAFQRIFRTDSPRVDWFDLLAVQGTLKRLLQHHSLKSLLFHVIWDQPYIFQLQEEDMRRANWYLYSHIDCI